jgi:hypothetical protein
MSTNNVLISYNPNDFFYVGASNRNEMPSVKDCSDLDPYAKSWDNKCSDTMFSDNSYNCIKRELCINRDKGERLISISKNSKTANEKYMNEKMKYDVTLMNTINLGIGILFLIVIIYKNRK